jgi:nitrogen regulatory protein P-II 1
MGLRFLVWHGLWIMRLASLPSGPFCRIDGFGNIGRKSDFCIYSNELGRGRWINMTKIEAIIKPFRLTEVQEALIALGIQGMTVSEVKGFGRQKGHVELYRGAEYTVNFVPKLLIITVIPDELAERAVEAIQKAAFTGKIGDGKIFLSKIDEALRIRTKETGSEAL